MHAPTTKDLLSISPQLIVGVFGMLALLLDAIYPKISKRIVANLTVLGLVAAGVAAWFLWPHKGVPKPMLQGMVMADGYTAFFTLVFVLGAAISVLLSVNYLEKSGSSSGEYYALILFTILGAIVMAASVNLICIFIGLEVLSISLYILAGYQTEKAESDESALKYFLLGAFASAFFLYGIALVYGATGTLSIPEITEKLSMAPAQNIETGKNFLLLAGLGMLLVGFGFKVAVVPFHVWTPDVYEGAPTSVTAFMSVVAKAAGFAAFLRVVGSGFQDQSLQLQVSAVLASIAALTMLVGNVVAVVQKGMKRMLAYSSIAHAGYILCGVVAAVRPAAAGSTNPAQTEAITAVLFYTLVYTVSNLGAFGVLLALRKRGEEIQDVSDLAGVGARHPLLAALMSLFLLSLAGLPPLGGFLGKLALIQALVHMSTPLIWLIVLFALTSVVSFFYYLGVVRAMYLDPTEDEAGEGIVTSTMDWHHGLALAICAIGTVLLGLWSSGAFGLAEKVAQSFVGGGGPFSAMR